MSTERYLGNDLYYVGYSDMRINRFENMIPLHNGVSYNSYLIKDDKTCLIDTVDGSILLQFNENVLAALDGRNLDYIAIHHMEPDHCAGIVELMRKFPECKIVGNTKTFTLLKQFRGDNFPDRQVLVGEGDVLDLGTHKLKFIMAPLVHWPEVMFSYDEKSKILFTADAFGSFNYLSGNMYSDNVNYDEYWLAEARRYYTNIVGKQGVSVQKVLAKVSSLEVQQIFPLHGVIHRDKNIIDKLLNLYNKWSKYEPEEKGVVFIYSSMYGNMEECCLKLANRLDERNVKNIRFFDVAQIHDSYLLAEIFRYSHLVVGVVNHNTKLYHEMASCLSHFAETNMQNRKFSLLASKSWGGKAKDEALAILSSMKNFEQIGDTFEILSTIQDSQLEELDKLADEISTSINM